MTRVSTATSSHFDVQLVQPSPDDDSSSPPSIHQRVDFPSLVQVDEEVDSLRGRVHSGSEEILTPGLGSQDDSGKGEQVPPLTLDRYDRSGEYEMVSSNSSARQPSPMDGKDPTDPVDNYATAT